VVNPRAEINRRSEFKKTYIRRGATIGANATILCGLEIGQYAFVAAGAVVTSDIPDYALVMGVPAKQNGWMSRIGNAMNFDQSEFFKDEDGTKYQLLNGKVSLLD
jgi:UDP-2-acetamido-3-amino-2,3-dideoxy-glucuronate N-acetyltransferase